MSKSIVNKLVEAAGSNNIEKLTTLLAKASEEDINDGIDFQVDNRVIGFDYAMNALMAASAMGHLDAVKLLVEAEADVDLQNFEDDDEYVDVMTPLMHAAHDDHSEVVAYLIAAGADLELADNGYLTAIMHATENGSINSVRLLIEANADVNYVNDSDDTVLDHAVNEHQYEIAQLLRAAGAVEFDNLPSDRKVQCR